MRTETLEILDNVYDVACILTERMAACVNWGQDEDAAALATLARQHVGDWQEIADGFDSPDFLPAGRIMHEVARTLEAAARFAESTTLGERGREHRRYNISAYGDTLIDQHTIIRIMLEQ